MKDVIQISFSVKVEASPLAKGLTEPFAKIINKAIPLLERAGEALVEGFETEAAERKKKAKE